MLGAIKSPADQPTKRAAEQSAWWQHPSTLVERFRGFDGEAGSCDWYRIVDAFLGIESEDFRLRNRFKELYGEFLRDRPQASERVRSLHCRVQVRDDAPAHLVTFTAPEEVRIVDFILDLYHDRGYVEMHEANSDWRSLGVAGTARPLLTAKGAHVFVDASQTWQPLVATCAMNWVMRMQRDLLFFHAAAVGIDGAGVLITGGKGAGKSTLSMALAVEGHDFLGDEIAAVRSRTLELSPFRRAVSIRPGPQARRVEQSLRNGSHSTEQFPDGTTRTRAEAGKLFPRPVADSLPLRCVFFLRDFEKNPRAEAFLPRAQDLSLLAPLPCTFWSVSPSRPMMAIAKLLSSVNCYYLHPGSPEATARLVEEIVRTR